MADKWFNQHIDKELEKADKMKLKTLEQLLQHGAILIDKDKDIGFYKIGNDRYIVINEKIIDKYRYDDEKLRSDDIK